MEIKTAEQYVLRELENSQREVELLGQRIKDLERLYGVSHEEDKEEVLLVDVRPYLHTVGQYDLVRISDILRMVKEDKKIRHLAIKALTDDESLLEFSEIKVPHLGCKVVHPYECKGLYKVDFKGNSFSIVEHDVTGLEMVPVNREDDSLLTGKLLGERHRIVLEHLRVVLKEYEEELTKYDTEEL